MPPLDHAERLRALQEANLLDRPSRESLDRYVRIAQAALGVPVSLVSLVDDHRQFFTSAVGLPEPVASRRETPLSHSFCKHVVEEEKPLIVEDARQHSLVRDNLAIPDFSVIAYAGMPVGAQGQIYGSFCAIDTQPRRWREHELTILAELAAAVSAEMDLIRRANRAERSERQLAALNQALTRDQESALRHTATLVHDVRTPLGVISQGLQGVLAHETVVAFPELGRLLEMMQRNVEHAASILASRHDSNEPSTSSLDGEESQDLAAVVREVCADLGGQGNAEVVLTGNPGPLHVQLDGTELRRCCENLLTNARRFAHSRILVRLEAREGGALLSVEDDGPGLPDAEAYRRVWDRSVRYHVEDGRSGKGLGLSIVKDLVERAGGHTEAHPSVLGGARFQLYMPSAEAPTLP